MPIWLRNFTFKKIEEHYNKVNAKPDDLMANTEKMKEIQKINPSQFKQFNFDKTKKSGTYSKK